MDAIARDPDVPSAGNPQGDVTIAAFSDYNCPFCKATERNLDRSSTTMGKSGSS